MREIASGLVVFVLLCASAGLGILIRPRLPEHHRTRETVELTQITIGLLVTFAAVVLGLLTASVKHGYDSAAQDRRGCNMRSAGCIDADRNPSRCSSLNCSTTWAPIRTRSISS